MITATAPADTIGVAVLAEVARTAIAGHGGGGEAAALAVRLLADDAKRRMVIAEESSDLDLSIDIDGTELVIQLRDRGEPVSGPPASLLTLVDLGLATAADGRIDGTSNLSEIRVPLPSHGRMLDDADLEVLTDDVALSDAPVTIRQLEVGDAAALTRCIYRCYGWSYPGTDLYFPDRIAASIESGKRVGEVAVDDQGEMAAHWGAVFVAEGVVETGGTVTDPRFRRRGLVNQLGDRLLERLITMGVRGRMREPVLTHTATQHIALREGAHMIGLRLNVTSPLQQVGITDGLMASRLSLTVMFSPLAPLEPSVLWIPHVYEPPVRHVLEPTDWPIELATVRGAARDCPERSVLGSSYDAVNHLGAIEVATVGDDLVDAIDDALTQLRHGGAEVVVVRLPANQPALATVGAGLGGLGLGFAALLPSYGLLGDTLELQWLRDPEIDTSEWHFATEQVEQLARQIVDQAGDLGDQATKLRRRLARRQQLFAALPTTSD
jgi:hypothetical protein